MTSSSARVLLNTGHFACQKTFDIVICHSWRRRSAAVIQWAQAGILLTIPQTQGEPTTQCHLAKTPMGLKLASCDPESPKTEPACVLISSRISDKGRPGSSGQKSLECCVGHWSPWLFCCGVVKQEDGIHATLGGKRVHMTKVTCTRLPCRTWYCVSQLCITVSKHPRHSPCKKERAVSIHAFRGFEPQLLSPLALGPWQHRSSVQRRPFT